MPENGEGPSHQLTRGSFSSASLSVRAQKKIASKFATRNVTKFFLPDSVDVLFDRLFTLLKDYYPKKDAEKVVKNMIKLAVKVCIMGRNGLLSSEDEKHLDTAQKRLHTLAVTTVSFQKVAYSFDREYYLGIMDHVQDALEPLVDLRLSDKSSKRLLHVFKHLTNGKMLDDLFAPGGPYTKVREDIVASFESLIESGNI